MFFGGHDYLERTTGVTYADYVHQGFGQLTVATALTLLVVWAAARRAGDAPTDRLWLRLSLGLLCVLTLVVVASALYRMHVYQEAYGFTTLRLVVDVFEGWLGVVVLTVMVAGGLGLRALDPADRARHRRRRHPRAGGAQPRRVGRRSATSTATSRRATSTCATSSRCRPTRHP